MEQKAKNALLQLPSNLHTQLQHKIEQETDAIHTLFGDYFYNDLHNDLEDNLLQSDENHDNEKFETCVIQFYNAKHKVFQKRLQHKMATHTEVSCANFLPSNTIAVPASTHQPFFSFPSSTKQNDVEFFHSIAKDKDKMIVCSFLKPKHHPYTTPTFSPLLSMPITYFFDLLHHEIDYSRVNAVIMKHVEQPSFLFKPRELKTTIFPSEDTDKKVIFSSLQ